MSYRFKVGESVAAAVHRISSEEIRSALGHLTASDPSKRETDIHEARKAIKRLRALLRLVRAELGVRFQRENAALRDIGRSLSDLRDSTIVLQTFDSLSRESSDPKRLQDTRDGLQQQKEAKDNTTNLEKTLGKAAVALAKLGERVSTWTLHSDGFEAIADGLKDEYRGGRRAMSKALGGNESLLFHEWRKRAKSQLFHLRLLRNFLDGPLKEQEEQLHRLETALGDDHNLLILRQHLEGHPSAFGGKKVVLRSLRLAVQRERQLRAEAEALGQSIYAIKPKEFVALLQTGWEKRTRHGRHNLKEEARLPERKGR